MINSGMMICSFFLKKKHSRGIEKIHALNKKYICYLENEEEKEYVDIFDMLQHFCNDYALNKNDEKKMKTFSIKKDSIKFTEDDMNRSMFFTVISGGYGIESDMTDSNTSEVLFHRETHVADNKHFNVLVFVPKDQGDVIISKGIMIFQTIGTYGVKTLTAQNMRVFFSNIGLTFDTRSISVRLLIEKMIEHGHMHRITLVKNSISPDKSDNIFITTGEEQVSYIRPVLQPAWLQKMLLFFERTSKDAIYEIDGEEYGDIRIQFKLGNRERTASLRTIDKFSVVEDIPETIYRKGADSIKEYMIDTAIAYKEKMVFTIENGD